MCVLGRLAQLAILVPIVLLSACEPPEAADVRASYDQVMQAINARQGKEAVALLNQKSIDQYERSIVLARSGTRAQIRAVPPIDRASVAMMRNRLTPTELASLSGRDWIILAVDRGWYADDPGDPAFELGKMTFQGSSASAEIVIDGDRTGHYYDFDLVDGVWKLDWVRVDDLFNEWIAEAAADAGMTQDEYILEYESIDSGIPVGDEVWGRAG